ncbi:MAG: HAD-IIA family hydrolase [Planctomycetes bacterium]|nr:HAD-IIA family hydrolase [Planctomycetota bacterium]
MARALLIDVDGTLTVGGRPVDGAPQALASLRRAGIPFLLVTNTTRFPLRQLVADLSRQGFSVHPDEVFPALRASARFLRRKGWNPVWPLVVPAAMEDLTGLKIAEEGAEAVLVGDLGEEWNFDLLNRALQALHNGAELVAIHKNRTWRTGEGLMLDTGPFVAALEYAADVKAHVVGKPSDLFYREAADILSASFEEIVSVGDDVESDVASVIALKGQGVLVRTGKYVPGQEDRAKVPPTDVLDSIASLPKWLGL